MVITSYNEVAALDAAALRSLLVNGDPVERVWAAWGLAMTLGSAAIPALSTSVRESPAAGTRRHLIVVLAGLGERQVLETLANLDPDDFVRATAWRYVVRIAHETIPGLAHVLVSDPSARVREALLDEAVPRLVQPNKDGWQHLLADDDIDVRRLALERALTSLERSEHIVDLVIAHIPLEPDTKHRYSIIASMIHLGAVEKLLAASIHWPSHHVREIFSLLPPERRIPWAQLAPIAERLDASLEADVIRCLESRDTPLAWPWLIRSIVRHVHYSENVDKIMDLLLSTPPVPLPLDAQERSDLKGAIAWANIAAAHAAENMKIYDATTDDEWEQRCIESYHEEFKRLSGLIALFKELLGSDVTGQQNK